MSMLPILAASVLVFCLSADASIGVQEAFRSLFNGKDLEGWNGDASGQSRDMESAGASTVEPQRAFKDHWSVEGGELVNDGEGPWAATDEEFGDVELTLEYRTAAAHAGICPRGPRDKPACARSRCWRTPTQVMRNSIRGNTTAASMA